MTNETPAERLGQLVRARRKALKMTQMAVQESGGPSTATLRLIEGGKHTDFRDGTGADLEKALRWQPGSIDKILAENGEPTEAGTDKGVVSRLVDDTAAAEHTILHTWPMAARLVEAVVQGQPSEELRAATRRVVGLIAEFLTHRALSSSSPVRLQGLLRTLEDERAELFRRLASERTYREGWPVAGIPHRLGDDPEAGQRGHGIP